MNVLFLIGNGFDLKLGLKTSYKDVLKVYLEKPNDKPYIKKFKQDIKRDLENWSDFEKQMGVYTEKFTAENLDDYRDCIRDFRETLAEHLRQEESRIDNTHKEKIAPVLYDSITKFYGKLQQGPRAIILSVFTNTSHQYTFMTFNYTNVIDKCLKLLDPNKVHINAPILHIHGTTKTDMILGIDNVEQIANKELSNDDRLKPVLIKPYINENLGNLNNETGVNFINNSDIICIFGSSLGESDKSWWQNIQQWLGINHRKHLIIFAFTREEVNSIHSEDTLGAIKKIRDKFFSITNISSKERDKYKKQIHIAFNTDMFNWDLDLTK